MALAPSDHRTRVLGPGIVLDERFVPSLHWERFPSAIPSILITIWTTPLLLAYFAQL